jgi:1,4-dihydroxy-2-naphthoyl-CoA hydrolase
MTTFFERAGGTFLEMTPERAVAQITVNDEMLQKFGIMTGGMSAYLAELVASDAACQGVDLEHYRVMGTEVISRHLLPVMPGDTVKTVATPISRGHRIQVWKIEQYRESDGALFNVSQMTTYTQKKHQG